MADRYLDILHQYWGYSDFRGIQRDIIESIGAGKDTLGLMPTGGGKSVTFQVPALASDGVCIVVTPLIALMKDQVQHMRNKGIDAQAIYSGMTHGEILKTLENCAYGHVKLLYVSPERLGSDLFLGKLKGIRVSFITVDEAHCISQWGYDFRPSYLKIAEIRRLKPDAPVLALTATATPQVVEDIQEKLKFKKKNVFRMSFERKNLAYVVRNTTDKPAEMIHILNSVDGSAIVYAHTRKHVRVIADILNEHGIKATYYHAGLDPSVKDQRQKDWQEDNIRVIVATNAFGMGIDKPNVRLVIHADCPDSIEAYFQEAGRAGRDGQKAYAVLLYDNSDKRNLKKRISDSFPPKEYVRNVYEHLAYFFQIATGEGRGRTCEFRIQEFCAAYHFARVLVDSSLRILQRCGYILYEMDPQNNARLRFLLERQQLYLLDNLSPIEDRVITALFRLYCGLFSDYVYIDESLVGKTAGTDQQHVYVILRDLSRRRIVDFVPQRKTPYITYLTDRVDGSDVVIPREAYETRKEQYEKRMGAMLEYATNDEVCRPRLLLRYFGEPSKHDCGQCDVCLSYQNRTKDMAPYRQAILNLLNDKQQHHITELRTLPIPTEDLKTALNELYHEEMIVMDGAFIKSMV